MSHYHLNKNKNYEIFPNFSTKRTYHNPATCSPISDGIPWIPQKNFQFDKNAFRSILDQFHKKSMENHWNWSVSLNFFVWFHIVCVHQIRLISLFRHFSDHFQFHPTLELKPMVDLKSCNIYHKQCEHGIWITMVYLCAPETEYSEQMKGNGRRSDNFEASRLFQFPKMPV